MTNCAAQNLTGLYLDVYERDIDAAGKPTSDWRLVGHACSGDTPVANLLTPQMVETAFEHLPFTPPTAAIQPPGGRTLVNLTTYYEATFPGTRIGGRASVGPGGTATVTLLGHRVVITPRATSYTFDFGDHQSSGPTTDPGGPYPTGHITHTYRTHGEVTVRITTTYGGSYTVDGSAAIPLRGAVDITGRPFALDVLTATNRLYATP